MKNSIYAIMKRGISFDIHCRFFNNKEKAIEELKKLADKYDFVRWENNELFYGFINGKKKQEVFYIKKIENN